MPERRRPIVGRRGKLTRADQIALATLAKERAARNKLIRRITTGTGAVIGGAALIGFVTFESVRNSHPTTSSTFVSTPALNPDGKTMELMIYEQIVPIIAEEVRRQNIKPSEKEQKLWVEAGFHPLPRKLPKEEEEKEGSARIQRTLNLMRSSENPYLKEAGDFIRVNVDSGKVRLRMPSSIRAENLTIAAASSIQHEGGRLFWTLELPQDQVLYRSSSVDIAISIVHEVDHIRNSINFIATLPSSYTAEEKYQRDIERLTNKNKNERIAEEARGNGKEALARIYQFGLGFTFHVTDLEDAAVFIKFGKNTNDPRWQNYVATTLLRLSPN